MKAVSDAFAASTETLKDKFSFIVDTKSQVIFTKITQTVGRKSVYKITETVV